MGRKRHKPEEIVAKLRQVEVLTTQGQSVVRGGGQGRVPRRLTHGATRDRPR